MAKYRQKRWAWGEPERAKKETLMPSRWVMADAWRHAWRIMLIDLRIGDSVRLSGVFCGEQE
jgi:hypothetical protein